MNCEYSNFLESNSAPYSDLVLVDHRYLFLSGLISIDPATGDYLAGNITFETKQIFDRLETVLDQYGSDMDHVVRVEILLSDFSDRSEMNAEYIRHFSRISMPARLCFGGVDLADGCKIEVMVTAVKRE